MKIILNKKIITLLFSIVFLFLFSNKITFAVWDELPYDPGETDNPECLPSQTDCDVYPAIITETDPVFIATEAFTITGADTINWDTAYGWGNHASAGYVTGTPWTLLGYITDGNTGWDNSYGFITSYTETDPIFVASQAHNILSGDITNLSNLSGTNTGDDAVNSLYSGLATSKQDTLVSGSNIKTINSASLLGSTDILLQTPLTAGVNYEVPLTFGSGLTRATNTITNNLIIGLAGGQTIIGGTQESENLTLSSTSHATKGKILFGTSAYDEVNNRLGISTTSPAYKFQVSDGTNAFLSADSASFRTKFGRGVSDLAGQTLDIGGHMKFSPVTQVSTTGMTVAPAGAGAGNLNNGVYSYQIVYVTADGETGADTYYTNQGTIVDKTTDGKMLLSNIPVNPDPRVTNKKIYRSVVNGGIYFGYYIDTITNTTTTYTDNIADTTVGSYFYQKANTTAGYMYSGSSLIMASPDLYHTYLGVLAGSENTTGNSIVFIGGGAGQKNTKGTNNTAVGYQSLYANTEGSTNNAFGYMAVGANKTGVNNSGFGLGAVYGGINVNYNSGFGNNSLQGLITNSNYNSGVGQHSGYNAMKDVASLGNLFLGAHQVEAGTNPYYIMTSGNYNIFVGYGTDSITKTSSNFLNIGNLIYGTGVGIVNSTPSTTPKIGLGINTPEATLHIADTGVVASENLTNGVLTSGTSWTNSGDFALTSNAGTYTHSSGSGYIQQESGTLAVAGIANRLYILTYTISGVSGTAPTATITTAFSLSATTLVTNRNGTYTAVFRSAVSPADFRIAVTSSATGAFTIDTLSLKEVTGGTELINGKLGIGLGITSPTETLSISGSSAQKIWMERNTTATTAGQGLTLHSGGAIAGTADLAGGDLTLSSGISTGTGTSSIHFFTATAGTTGTTDRTPTEKMTILGSGNVGIGTTSPSSKLDVTTNSLGVTQTTTSGLALINTTAAALDTQQISPAIRWSGYGWGTTAGASQAINFRAFVMPVQGPTVEGYLSFGSSVADGAYSDGQMVLTNNGNLGVGTTGPTKKVEITNNSTTMSSLTFYSDAWGGRIGTKIGNGSASALYLEPENGDVRLYVSGVDSKLIGYNGSGNASFSFNTNGDSYLSAIAGNVGIRQTSPGYLLHVGSTSVTDATVLLRLQDADSACDFTANAGAPTCGSDETLKKNINDQSDNLSKIIALRPVTYNWLTDLDGVEIKHGFIAQEVANIMPELVTDGIWIDGTTKKFLQTAGMTPYIVGAIKEMNLKLLDLNNFEKENDWRDSLVAWLANAENRITRIFTGEICLTEAGQESVCINRTELQSLKALLNNSSTNTATSTSTTTTITTTDNNDGSTPIPTCSDGVKNQDETDIDIGGVCTQVEEQEELVDEPDVVSETVITEEENVLEEEIPDEETLEPDVTTEVEEVVPATDEEEADQITNDDESSL